MRWEEQRKAMQQDAYQKQEVAKYQDQLARQRAEADHEKQRVRNIELVRLQVCGTAAVAAQAFSNRTTVETDPPCGAQRDTSPPQVASVHLDSTFKVA